MCESKWISNHVQVFATENAFSEEIVQRALERAKALQGHVQMPPAMITSLDKLVSSALAARRAAMPAPESLQSSVQAALSLTLPETGEFALFLQFPNRGNVEA